jgi:hypothetical protein
MKKLLKIVGVLFVLLIVALVVVYLFASSIIRPIVESTASKSLQVPTTLGGADLHAFVGNLTLSDLNVANPKPFDTDTPQFVTFKSCSVTLQPTSLIGNTVKINEIKIDGLTLCISQQGIKSNVMAIMNNLKQASGASQGESPSSTQGGSKQLDIDNILLTNTKISVRAGGIPGMKSQGFDIVLENVQIPRPLDAEGRLPKMANLMGQILTKIAQQATNDPRMPEGARAIMGSVAQLGGDMGKNLNLGNLEKGLQDFTKKAPGNLGKDLGNLFGGKKEPPK